jgi:hypothetical protein
MGISESVERLASIFAAHVRKLPQKDPILVVLLAEIGTMPMWRDMGALDQWERRVKMVDINREVRERAGDRLLKLADEVFDVGEYNLYGAIAPLATKAEFERVASLLREAGVAGVPQSDEFDFHAW